MMTLDRMELADLVAPDAIAQGIIKQLPDLTLPVPIDDIARALDIVDIQAIETQGFEGGLVTFPDKSEGTILVNKRNTQQRQRFTVGHELGHFLCPWHNPAADNRFLCKSGDFISCDTTTKNKMAKMEAEANRFSACLLMPLAQIRKHVRSRKEPSLVHIWELADVYDVSKEALGRRYIEIHDECCALVLSRNGEFLHSYRHDDFPYINFIKDQPLPKGSVCVTDGSPEGGMSDWEEIQPETWTNQPAKLSALYEQTVLQANGYRMTLLQAELRDEEDDAEETGLQESWTPRFRK